MDSESGAVLSDFFLSFVGLLWHSLDDVAFQSWFGRLFGPMIEKAESVLKQASLRGLRLHFTDLGAT
jgi:hypothetical protein